MCYMHIYRHTHICVHPPSSYEVKVVQSLERETHTCFESELRLAGQGGKQDPPVWSP